MNEKTLLLVALIVSIFGIIILYAISAMLEIETAPVGKMTTENPDGFVKVNGIILGIAETDAAAFITVQQQNQITAIIFKNEGDIIGIQKGMNVEFIGKMDQYNGNAELIVHKARVIG